MVAFAVGTQTGLVEAEEKPSVTPAQLSTWAAWLLAQGDAECAAVANKARATAEGVKAA